MNSLSMIVYWERLSLSFMTAKTYQWSDITVRSSDGSELSLSLGNKLFISLNFFLDLTRKEGVPFS